MRRRIYCAERRGDVSPARCSEKNILPAIEKIMGFHRGLLRRVVVMADRDITSLAKPGTLGP